MFSKVLERAKRHSLKPVWAERLVSWADGCQEAVPLHRQTAFEIADRLLLQFRARGGPFADGAQPGDLVVGQPFGDAAPPIWECPDIVTRGGVPCLVVPTTRSPEEAVDHEFVSQGALVRLAILNRMLGGTNKYGWIAAAHLTDPERFFVSTISCAHAEAHLSAIEPALLESALELTEST